MKLIRKILSRIDRQSVTLTASVSLLVQLGRPLISLVTLPMLLGHLGQAGLGVWMIALSLIGLIGSVNSGLSISLVTLIGRASAKGSQEILQRLVSAATLIAALTAGVIVSVTVPAALVLDWTSLLSLGTNPSGEQVRWMMVTLAVLLAFGIIASVPRQVMLGKMHGYISQLLDLAGLLASVLGLIIGVFLKAPLWLLSLLFVGPSTAIVIFGGMLYLRHAGLRLFSRNHLYRETIAALGGDSLRMAGYQTAYSISSQSDLFLIGIILGPNSSAAYGIAQRIFSLPIMMAATVNNAQWPAIARADATGDHAIIKKMFYRTLIIGTAGATTVAISTALGYKLLLDFWLGRQLVTDPLIIVGMVAWVLVGTLVSTCDMILRARNETMLLMRSMMAMAVVNIATTLALLPIIGASGAIWGSVTGYALALLVPYSLRLSKTLSEFPFNNKADASNDGKPAFFISSNR